ncbi:MAG TPA: primosomal replication protein N [Anaerolineae bacterium]|nr:primosomal replication protein N [Anaerolineae bacterium]
MKVFSGFPTGKVRSVVLPEPFFDELLPLIDDLIELKVTLACLRILSAKSGLIRWITWSELLADRNLMRGLNEAGEAGLEQGLRRAIERGALLKTVDRGSGETLYFANTERGRAALGAIERGASVTTIEVSVDRSNIFHLYEQTVGTLTPLIADELREAERDYPAVWIEEAFRDAARQNARAWAYVRKILETRKRRDKRHEAVKRDIGREWQEFIERTQPPHEDDFPF